MNSEQILRKQLVQMLAGGNAYGTFEEIVKDFPTGTINDLFPNGDYSAWALLEHIRLTQRDILDFMIDPKYKEPQWPQDYWPKKNKKATKSDWDKTIQGFTTDLKKLQTIAKDPKVDLYSKIAWGSGQTILREILLVSEHNSYHLGEFSIMRQVMGTWSKSHK